MAVVDRCICYNRTFAELKTIALRLGNDLERLSRETGCCDGCGLCRPYIERMLRTGEKTFPLEPAPPPIMPGTLRPGER